MSNVTQYVLSYIRVSEAGLKDRYYLVVRQNACQLHGYMHNKYIKIS